MAVVSSIDLEALLGELAAKHRVPGASVAVLDDGQVTRAATGMTSKSTQVDVTEDTVFQIGSITKIWTTTLVMQLVDSGDVDLDMPAKTYLPELEFGNGSITVRQLLCHTSGVDGDHFPDTGRGDDCVERYVSSCSTLAQLAPPGSFFSYSNAAFVVAGRLLEKHYGRPWDAVLNEKIVAPLGLKRTVTLPEDAILHRAAVGHIDPTDSGDLTPTPVFLLPRSCGPAGIITSTAEEVLAFARMHLDRGLASDGTRVLSRASVDAMQEVQIELVGTSRRGYWGLGWMLFDWEGKRVIGHDGATIGQYAFLRLLPESGFAVCLLTNTVSGGMLYRDLFGELFSTKAGISPPADPKADPSLSFDPLRYAGRYEREGYDFLIEDGDAGICFSMRPTNLLKDIEAPVVKRPMQPFTEHGFLVRTEDRLPETPVVFLDFDESGKPRYMHFGGRATPRVG